MNIDQGYKTIVVSQEEGTIILLTIAGMLLEKNTLDARADTILYIQTKKSKEGVKWRSNVYKMRHA